MFFSIPRKNLTGLQTCHKLIDAVNSVRSPDPPQVQTRPRPRPRPRLRPRPCGKWRLIRRASAYANHVNNL